ncbi:RNA polymerase sigma factor [Fredinandcohnia humi]
MLREQALIEDCRNGQKQAFGQLVEPLLSKAYRTALGILGSGHLAEDAVQNALLEAYTTIMNQKKFTNFNAWFNRLVISRSLDLARKHFKEVNNTYNIEDYEPSNLNEPPGILLRNEQFKEFQDMIYTLNVNQRIVLTLYYFQEYTIEEIAGLLHTNTNTIKTRLSRARKNLQKKFLMGIHNEGGIHNGG